MNEHEFWVRIWALVVVGIVAFTVALCVWSATNRAMLIKHGYCERERVGGEGTILVPCKEVAQ